VKQPAFSSNGFGRHRCRFRLRGTCLAIHSNAAFTQGLPPQPEVTVHQIGDALMHHFVLQLEIMGLLLTAALIGAVVIAMDTRRR